MCLSCGNPHHIDEDKVDLVNIGGASVGSASLPTYSINQAANYLVNGFWSDVGESPRKFDVSTGGKLTYSLAGLESAGKWFAQKAFEAWSAVTGITFVRNDSASADIVFDDDDSGAYAWSTFDSPGIIDQSFVNVSTAWYSGEEYDLHSYSFQTYVHEIGHALGLGHAGDYNGSGSYPYDATFKNDSWQMTVMSYFAQDENPNIDADYAFLLTPMAADIIAMKMLYGTPTSVNTGNTVWGYGSNASGPAAEFASLAEAALSAGAPGYYYAGVAMTVLDSGGVDTFDFSQTNRSQRIDLRQEQFSDVLGYEGNLTIAKGTVIENAKGGNGKDTIIGNSSSNSLKGNGGDDYLSGSAGNDYLVGGSGADRLVGGSGRDLLNGGVGRDVLNGGTGFDTADYRQVTSRVVIDLRSNSGSEAAAGDKFYSIEGIYGGTGRDTLKGTGGINVFKGYNGNDTLIGRGGADQLHGNNGSDRLKGGAGADRLFGDQGDDFLFGGNGKDRFYYDDGRDVIKDFRARQKDKIFIDDDLTGGMSARKLLKTKAKVVKGDVHIKFGNGDKLIIEDVSNKMSLVDDIQFY